MDTSNIIALIIGVPGSLAAMGTFLLALRVNRKVEIVHQATNGLKDELVEATRVAAKAAGVLEGIQEEKDRHNRGGKK